LIKLYQVIYNKLTELGIDVIEKDNVNREQEFPFITISLPSMVDLENLEIFNLEIDVWGRVAEGVDTTVELENITNDILNLLNKYRYVDEEISVRFEFLNLLNIAIPEPTDKKIRRKQILFQARTFFLI